ncbi:hypothetical protein BJX64DRAFT_291341 [Aspergillus heterothallicus]
MGNERRTTRSMSRTSTTGNSDAPSSHAASRVASELGRMQLDDNSEEGQEAGSTGATTPTPSTARPSTAGSAVAARARANRVAASGFGPTSRRMTAGRGSTLFSSTPRGSAAASPAASYRTTRSRRGDAPHVFIPYDPQRTRRRATDDGAAGAVDDTTAVPPSPAASHRTIRSTRGDAPYLFIPYDPHRTRRRATDDGAAGADDDATAMPPPPVPIAARTRSRTSSVVAGAAGSTGPTTNSSASGHARASAGSNIVLTGHIPLSGLSSPVARAMLQRAAARGNLSTTSSAPARTTRSISSRAAAGASTGASSASAGAAPSAGGAALGGVGVGTAGEGSDDEDDSMADADEEDGKEEEEDKEVDEEEQHGEERVARTSWDGPLVHTNKYNHLPMVVYSLPTEAQMERIVSNYRRYTKALSQWTLASHAMRAFRQWLKMRGYWDGSTTRPEVHFDQLARLTSARGRPAIDNMPEARNACDRCLFYGVHAPACNMRLTDTDSDACRRCINANMPCTFTNRSHQTAYLNGTGRSGGLAPVNGGPGLPAITFQLPNNLDADIPPAGLPTLPGSFAQVFPAPKRRIARRRAKAVAPAPTHSEFSEPEDRGSDVGAEEQLLRMQEQEEGFERGPALRTNKMARNPGSFFVVPSRRQLLNIVRWWFKRYGDHNKAGWDQNRRAYQAYLTWARDHGWFQEQTQRFELHYNVLAATRNVRYKPSRRLGDCDRCRAHGNVSRCGIDASNNACMTCIRSGVPCTLTRDMTHTIYFNGSARAPPGVTAVQGGQHIDYVTEYFPPELLFTVMGPGAPSHMRATSTPALPPPPPGPATAAAGGVTGTAEGEGAPVPMEEDQDSEGYQEYLETAQQGLTHWNSLLAAELYTAQLMRVQFESAGLFDEAIEWIADPTDPPAVKLTDALAATRKLAENEQRRYTRQRRANRRNRSMLQDFGFPDVSHEAPPTVPPPSDQHFYGQDAPVQAPFDNQPAQAMGQADENGNPFQPDESIYGRTTSRSYGTTAPASQYPPLDPALFEGVDFGGTGSNLDADGNVRVPGSDLDWSTIPGTTMDWGNGGADNAYVPNRNRAATTLTTTDAFGNIFAAPRAPGYMAQSQELPLRPRGATTFAPTASWADTTGQATVAGSTAFGSQSVYTGQAAPTASAAYTAPSASTGQHGFLTGPAAPTPAPQLSSGEGPGMELEPNTGANDIIDTLFPELNSTGAATFGTGYGHDLDGDINMDDESWMDEFSSMNN